MELKEQYAEVWGLCPTDHQEAKIILEKAGRICYRSEDKIDENSAEGFLDRMSKKRHKAIWETSNMVVRTPPQRYPLEKFYKMMHLFPNKFITKFIHKERIYLGGNYRAWMEHFNVHHPNDMFIAIEELTSIGLEEVFDQDEIPMELKRIMCYLYTDRAVTHEMVRHRPASFLQESQRYVRYDGGMEFIKPHWFDAASPELQQIFIDSCINDEAIYKRLRDDLPPEDSRVVLPNACATTISITADIPEWELIFGLRTVPGVYPPTRQLACFIQKEFKEKQWVD